MKKLIAQKIGTDVVTGPATNDPGALGRLISNLFTFALLVGGLFLMYHLIMGALNWINSQGEKERVEKARKQLTNALIGFVILMSAWAFYSVVLIDIFGIFQRGPGGQLRFTLPSLF
jgi:cytochrome bd-type quinol oxidase subunit 2